MMKYLKIEEEKLFKDFYIQLLKWNYKAQQTYSLLHPVGLFLFWIMTFSLHR